MFYRDYKHKCPQCETKPNSYDHKKKTIIVYVPKATGIALPDYGIEGLNELRAAIEENNAYQESFHQMMVTRTMTEFILRKHHNIASRKSCANIHPPPHIWKQKNTANPRITHNPPLAKRS